MDKTILRFDFLAGMAAFISAVAFVVVQALQLFDVLYFPWDETFIYGSSLCIVVHFCTAGHVDACNFA